MGQRQRSTQIRPFWLCLFVYCLLLAGCTGSGPAQSQSNGGDGNTGQANSPARPSIVVTSPSGSQGFTSKNALVSLGGYASNEVTQVTWKSNLGPTGTASGTTRWKADNIPLSQGDNLILFTGTTPDGAEAKTTRTVTYNPSAATLSPLSAAPDYLFINEAATVKFSITLEKIASLDKSSLKIVQVDADGNPIATLGALLENGSFVFTGNFTLSSPTEGRLYYRMTGLAGGQPVQSEVLDLFVTTHVSGAELDTISSVSNQALAIYNETLRQTSSKETAQQATLSFLQGNSQVKKAGLSSGNGFGIWIEFTDKLLSCILLNPDGTRGGNALPVNRMEKRNRHHRVAPAKLLTLSEQTPPSQLRSGPGPLLAASETPEVTNSLCAGAFSEIFEPNDEYDDVGQLLQNADPIAYPANVLNTNSVTLDLWKTLDLFGVVYMTTHGDTVFETPAGGGPLEPTFTWNYPGGQVVVLTHQKVQLPAPSLEADLRAGRLCLANDGYVGILPAFVDHEYRFHPMRNSLVTMASCRSTYNDSMAFAFLGAGAKTYLGYSEYVSSTFCFSTGMDFVHRLLSQSKSDGSAFTTGDAFVPDQLDPHPQGPRGVQVLGHPDLPPRTAARFDLRGSTELSLENQVRHLAFTVQPSGSAIGATISPALQIAVQDTNNTTITNATNTITLSLGAKAGGGTLSGTLTVAAVNGIATFADLSIDKPGSGYTLVASTPKTANATVANSTSSPFDITNGVSHVLVLGEPAVVDGLTIKEISSFFFDPASGQLSPGAGAPIQYPQLGGDLGGDRLRFELRPNGKQGYVGRFITFLQQFGWEGFNIDPLSGALSKGTAIPGDNLRYCLAAGTDSLYISQEARPTLRFSVDVNGIATETSFTVPAPPGIAYQQVLMRDALGQDAVLYSSQGNLIVGHRVGPGLAVAEEVDNSPFNTIDEVGEIALHPNKRFLLAATVDSFSGLFMSLNCMEIDPASGAILGLRGTTTVPPNESGNFGGISVNADGMVIVNIGNHATLIRVSPSGSLSRVRNYPDGDFSAFDPGGKYVFRLRFLDNVVETYRVDPPSGDLTLTDSDSVPSPYDLKTVP